MKIRQLLLPLVLVLGGCTATSTGSPAPVASSPSAPPSARQPAPPSARPTPTFTDVSRGDTDSIVKLLSYEPGRHRAIVVEPVIFAQNPEFCELFGIPPDDKRCTTAAWDTADSDAKITLPRADDATYALVSLGDPVDCMDEHGAGKCKASAKEFDDWYGDGPQLIRLRTKNGVAVRLAELYVP